MSTLDLWDADGAGNRFVLVDVIAGATPPDPASFARDRCARADLDGVLLLALPKSDGDVRMVVYNADGSRPEACGNGLRCVALAAATAGHVSGERFAVETDAGTRKALVEASGRVAVELGAARVEAGERALVVDGATVRGVAVDVGNPHFVVRVETLADGRFERLGSALERHSDFPAGTNVEFVLWDGLRATVRVWERGVGETRACGTGAAAVAAVAADRWAARWPIAVALPGGVLEVERDAEGALWIAGPTRVERLGSPA